MFFSILFRHLLGDVSAYQQSIGIFCREKMLLPYLLMLISLTKCAKKLFTVIRSASISTASLFFFKFYRKTDMNAVWVDIVVVSQQYLKIKFFHISVGRMGNFFTGINIFKHTLKFKLEETRYVFCNILVMSYFPVLIGSLSFFTFSFTSL